MNNNPMTIVPIKNGFIFLPMDMDLLIQIGSKEKTLCVQTAATPEELASLVHQHFSQETDNAD